MRTRNYSMKNTYGDRNVSLFIYFTWHRMFPSYRDASRCKWSLSKTSDRSLLCLRLSSTHDTCFKVSSKRSVIPFFEYQESFKNEYHYLSLRPRSDVAKAWAGIKLITSRAPNTEQPTSVRNKKHWCKHQLYGPEKFWEVQEINILGKRCSKESLCLKVRKNYNARAGTF